MKKPSKNYTIRVRIILFFSTLVFLSGYIAVNSRDFDIPHVTEVREILLTMFSVLLIAFVYELFLRKEFFKAMEEMLETKIRETTDTLGNHLEGRVKTLFGQYNEINKEMLNSTIETSVKKITEDYLSLTRDSLNMIIEEKMPASTKRLRRGGIVDIYENMEVSEILEDIFKLKDQTINISSIWLPYIDTGSRAKICSSIGERGCSYRILIIHPKRKEAITIRANQMGDDVYKVSRSIQNTIETFEWIYRKVKADYPNVNVKEKLQLRLNESFISTSLIGYGDTFLLGQYLYQGPAFLGPQIKICNTGKYLFDMLKAHFDHEWAFSKKSQVNFDNLDFLKELRKYRFNNPKKPPTDEIQ